MKLNIKTSCKNIKYDAANVSESHISTQFWSVDICSPIVVDVLVWYITFENGSYIAHEDMGGWSKKIYSGKTAQEVVDWMEQNELKQFGDNLVWHEPRK